jgi:hypothetical protein
MAKNGFVSRRNVQWTKEEYLQVTDNYVVLMAADLQVGKGELAVMCETVLPRSRRHDDHSVVQNPGYYLKKYQELAKTRSLIKSPETQPKSLKDMVAKKAEEEGMDLGVALVEATHEVLKPKLAEYNEYAVKALIKTELQRQTELLTAQLGLITAQSEERVATMLGKLYTNIDILVNGPSPDSKPDLFQQEVDMIRTRGKAAAQDLRKATFMAPVKVESQKKKKKILIYGATDAQKQIYEQALPGVYVDVSKKDASSITGQYDYVIILKDFTGHADQGVLRRHYGENNVVMVSGVKSSAINAAKNRLMIA